ncbi:type IV toxin-antitoxin system AbiEi family antitoxin [Paraburkholderia phenazinium]|jgi:hypothetical protein|uniref:Uncharacterized protein n=1 Tax=Paraburkholderia phenazinium TaxID=60549 RepID=A0A1G8N7Y2_9BURK|nr:type IV toxin-antitoxin system AbiEi family antitoxin [Paraburkholderia phenazinium]SDI75680.1 hypothetical protein SAMN05216466_13331 [Paraburkholderia phenazinium]
MPPPSDLSFTERQLLDEACAAFQRATRRFKAKPVRASAVQPHAAHGVRMDGLIQFDVNGQKFNMPVLVKSRVEASGIVVAQHRMFVSEPNGISRRLMVVTHHVGADLAGYLIEQNVPFLDAAGNVYLSEPEGTVMVTGRPKPSLSLATPSARSTTRKGLEVMFALATQPGLVTRPYRTIAAAAGVSLNTVNQTLDDLMARGLVAMRHNGERVLPDWKRFVTEWVNHYPSRLRSRLGGRRFASTSPDWWRNFDFTAFGLSLGGEAAAEVMTNHLKASSVTIYSQAAVTKDFMIRARLRPDELGDVEILEAFWPPSPTEAREPHEPPLVHPLLIYADLVATGDSRNLSTAEQIYDTRLATLQP